VKALVANHPSQSLVRLTVLAPLLLAGSLLASAQGYDVFQTGSGASVDLSSLNLNLGVVQLQGVPIQTATGNADTIMYRPQAIPTTSGGHMTVNLYALFMKSTSPVNLSGHSADVYVTVNASGGNILTSTLPQPDALSASTGTITVYPNSQGTGGTFDSTITVNADVIFVTAGTSVTNSANYLHHQAAPAITLSQTGSSYSTTAPSGYPLQSTATPQAKVPGAASTSSSSSGYSSGGFYPRPVHGGPHPVVPAQTTCPPTHSVNSQTTGPVGAGTSLGPAPDIQKCVSPVTPSPL
jgi:hypothetical protein